RARRRASAGGRIQTLRRAVVSGLTQRRERSDQSGGGKAPHRGPGAARAEGGRIRTLRRGVVSGLTQRRERSDESGGGKAPHRGPGAARAQASAYKLCRG